MRSLSPVAAAAAMLALASTAGATIRQFSYDPADADTRLAAGGVTFMVNQTLLGGVRVLKMRATEAKATAELERVDQGVLGQGGLARAVGRAAPEHTLYRIRSRRRARLRRPKRRSRPIFRTRARAGWSET